MTAQRPEWWSNAEPELREAIAGFPDKLRAKLATKPFAFISRKNPFLFRIRGAQNPEEFTWKVLDAVMSSSEETIFGDVLEELAVIICKHARGGQKSGIENIDLEYTDPGGARVLVQVKSGVNWGNSSQKKSLRDAFAKATTILRQRNRQLHVRCVEGSCYGPSEVRDLGTHERIVGFLFWEEISGWSETADAVLELIGEYAENGLHTSRETAHALIVNYLYEMGVAEEGVLHWDKLLRLVMAEKGSGTRSAHKD